VRMAREAEGEQAREGEREDMTTAGSDQQPDERREDENGPQNTGRAEANRHPGTPEGSLPTPVPDRPMASRTDRSEPGVPSGARTGPHAQDQSPRGTTREPLLVRCFPSPPPPLP
jgi:hypothetical protein